MKDFQLIQAREQIAGFLKQKRLALGLTQQQLAERVGVTEGTVNRMENAHFWLRGEQLVKFCHELEIDLLKTFRDEE